MAVIKDFIPPVVKNFLLKLGFSGNRFRYGYRSWQEAQAKCSGYDSEAITQVLVSASRNARDGRVAYERDGVEFGAIQYSWPLAAAILGSPRSASKLKVLDWGGSLGSTYRQNMNLIAAAGVEVEWVVLEQEHLVEIGTREFSNTQLRFISNIESIPVGYFDLVILASSICYMDNPNKILEEVKSLRPRAIALDRTPIVKKGPELIGIQTVGRKIYRASYPIRVFSIGWIEATLSPKYRKVSEWVCDLQPDPKSISKGMFFLNSL